MSPYPAVPWPAQTPHPTASSSSSSPSPLSVQKRGKRSPGVPRSDKVAMLQPRGISNQSEIDSAKQECFDSSNAVWSCWPLNTTTVDQGDSTQFVWNSNQPSFRQFNMVDIALIRADNGHTVSTFTNQPNPTNRAGFIPLTVDDPWWGSDGSNWDGTPVSFPFYFLVDTSGDHFATAQPQFTFTAVQTTFASSVLASMSSASASSASSASLASLSSSASAASSASSASHAGGANPQGTNPSSLQNGSGSSSSFPHWAIAVITILGFFALLAFAMLIFLVYNRIRRDRENHPSRRGSMGSQSPIITKDPGGEDELASPHAKEAALGAVGAAGAAGAAGAYAGSEKGRTQSFVSPDGASTHSDTPFSGADAAVMAEAFRKALRKPDFAAQPVEEGESPGSNETGGQPGLLNRELAEEGRDLRSVDSSRGVRVETLPDEHEGDLPTERDSKL